MELVRADANGQHCETEALAQLAAPGQRTGMSGWRGPWCLAQRCDLAVSSPGRIAVGEAGIELVEPRASGRPATRGSGPRSCSGAGGPDRGVDACGPRPACYHTSARAVVLIPGSLCRPGASAPALDGRGEGDARRPARPSACRTPSWRRPAAVSACSSRAGAGQVNVAVCLVWPVVGTVIIIRPIISPDDIRPIVIIVRPIDIRPPIAVRPDYNPIRPLN